MRRALPLLLVAALALTACAAEQVTGQAAPAAGRAAGPQRIELTASDYQFAPNKIAVAAGEPVEVYVKNISESSHNITIKDPQGRKLVSEDLPPHSERKVCFTPTAPGRYEFFCNVDLHALQGMTGEFDAGMAAGAGS